jgi:hypothetical protein
MPCPANLPLGKETWYPLYSRAQWAVWMGAENFCPTRIQSLDNLAHSKPLYCICYPSPRQNTRTYKNLSTDISNLYSPLSPSRSSPTTEVNSFGWNSPSCCSFSGSCVSVAEKRSFWGGGQEVDSSVAIERTGG